MNEGWIVASSSLPYHAKIERKTKFGRGRILRVHWNAAACGGRGEKDKGVQLHCSVLYLCSVPYRKKICTTQYFSERGVRNHEVLERFLKVVMLTHNCDQLIKKTEGENCTVPPIGINNSISSDKKPWEQLHRRQQKVNCLKAFLQ